MPSPHAEPGPARQASDPTPIVDDSPTQSVLVVERAPSESVVHLHGDIDLHNAHELRNCIEALASDGQARVVLDLDELEFIDSSGLGAVIRGMRCLRQAGGELVLRHPKANATKILEISGLQRVFAIEA